jgi:hypothetical protein
MRRSEKSLNLKSINLNKRMFKTTRKIILLKEIFIIIKKKSLIEQKKPNASMKRIV